MASNTSKKKKKRKRIFLIVTQRNLETTKSFQNIIDFIYEQKEQFPNCN